MFIIRGGYVMKGSKILALFMSLMLCVSFLYGCSKKENEQNNNENTAGPTKEVEKEATITPAAELSKEPVSDSPLDKITNGYYIYAYPVEGIGDFTYFFHFYEEAPVIGSVFYAGFALNQINFTGTYKVEEKEFEYACFATREEANIEGAEPPVGTAPYTITFYDWEGNELDSCGFDGDVLYNDMTVITGIGGSPCSYNHDTEGEASKYYDHYQGEVGMAYLDFVADDKSSTLTLYHNGKYMDLVNMMVEGTWTMAETADGYAYTLKPDSDMDTPAVLTVAADKLSADYKPEGGEAIAMMNTSETGPKVFLTMKGEIPIGDSNADLIAAMFDDGTCTVIAAAYGQEMLVDAGAYAIGSDGYTITFQFDNAGEIISTLDAETKAVSIQYIQAGSMLGDIDTILTVVTE